MYINRTLVPLLMDQGTVLSSALKKDLFCLMEELSSVDCGLLPWVGAAITFGSKNMF